MMGMIERHAIDFIHVRLFSLISILLPNGEDGPLRLEYEESGAPGWRRLCEENENPVVVLAREFSISDSANPFYLKLRNSIPPAASSPVEARRNSPSRLFYPAEYSLPSTCLRRSSLFLAAGGGWTFLYFAAGSERGRVAPPPTRIFRPRDIGQQKLKSSIYSCTRERNNGRSFISRFKSRDAEILRT